MFYGDLISCVFYSLTYMSSHWPDFSMTVWPISLYTHVHPLEVASLNGKIGNLQSAPVCRYYDHFVLGRGPPQQPDPLCCRNMAHATCFVVLFWGLLPTFC